MCHSTVDNSLTFGVGHNRVYKTQNLGALFVRENGLFMAPANKGRFYHDGRFKTLLDVVNHYNDFFGLALTESEKLDLVEYLKSLSSVPVIDSHRGNDT